MHTLVTSAWFRISFDLDNGDGLTNWMQSVQVVSVCLKKGGAGVKREFWLLLNYKRSGNGPAVLLIHGFFCGPNYWLPLFNHLTPNFDVIAPTLPGFADSKTDQPLDNIDAFTECLVNFMFSLCVERYSVVGHSMGGVASYHWAALFPDRVRRAAPICGSAKISTHNYLSLKVFDSLVCFNIIFTYQNR